MTQAILPLFCYHCEMKLYLSSFGLGNHSGKLKELVGKKDAKVAVSVNALDFSTDLPRVVDRLTDEIHTMESLGFKAERLDLREFFHKDGLRERLMEYDLVWFSGGNTFILAKAFRQSGFDKVFDELVKSGQLVYGGYSAAFAVLYSSLRGTELVDDKDAKAEGYDDGEIWEGLGVIDFYPIVHFRSGHPESNDAEIEYNYVIENQIAHKTFRDGDVYIVAGSERQVFA